MEAHETADPAVQGDDRRRPAAVRAIRLDDRYEEEAA
jgi:hypothetical protein